MTVFLSKMFCVYHLSIVNLVLQNTNVTTFQNKQYCHVWFSEQSGSIGFDLFVWTCTNFTTQNKWIEFVNHFAVHSGFHWSDKLNLPRHPTDSDRNIDPIRENLNWYNERNRDHMLSTDFKQFRHFPQFHSTTKLLEIFYNNLTTRWQEIVVKRIWSQDVRMCSVEGQCADHYAMEPSVIAIINLFTWALIYASPVL